MKAKQPTIFLVIQSGFSARYLLRTEILKTLKEEGARIVLLTPNADEAYFRKEFGDTNVHIECLEVEKCAKYLNHSVIQTVLRRIRLQSLPRADVNPSIRLARQLQRQGAAQDGLRKRLLRCIENIAISLLSRSWLFRHLLILVERRLFVGHFHRALFKKYQPHLVVTTSLGYWHPDEYVMREARAHGAMLVPVILSWDNTTSYGMAAARPDYVVAWTEAMKQELVTYHDVEQDKVFVGGVAHFDLYWHRDRLLSCSELFTQLGLEPDKRVILFATKSPNTYPWNVDIATILAQAIEDSKLTEPCQLVVRLHPIYFRYHNGELVYQSLLDEFVQLEARYPFVHINRPRVLSQVLQLDTPFSEMVTLGSLLLHSDVLVNIFSTVAIEAGIFDLPTIHVAFEGSPDRKRKLRDSIEFDMAQTHNQRVVQTGGVSIAHGADELINQVNLYLEDRSLHAEGRLRIREQECGPFPGSAGKTIGSFLLSLLHE